MRRKTKKSFSESIQRIPLFLLFVMCFGFVFIVSNIAKEPKPSIVFIPSSDEKVILSELESKGYIKNKISYLALMLASKFGDGIRSGGYALTSNQTALALYKELIDPTYKYVAIQEGLRKEEIANKYGKELNWGEKKTNEFQKKFDMCEFTGPEGKYFPGTYLISKDASIQDIKEVMEKKFTENYEKVLNTEQKEIFDADQVLIIASLIQREAAGKSDMRLISGVIWNRIFAGMPLQIDATLQYVKGEDGKWWPQVKSEDKYLDSPFNTYQNKGLPPDPISNPGPAAIEAAINPLKTDCIFYLHDKRRVIHCSKTYEGHLINIKNYL